MDVIMHKYKISTKYLFKFVFKTTHVYDVLTHMEN